MERACGLDVHKDSVFSCIINENGEIISKKFGVLTPDLEELRRHLVENHVDAARKRGTYSPKTQPTRTLSFDNPGSRTPVGGRAAEGHYLCGGGALNKHTRT